MDGLRDTEWNKSDGEGEISDNIPYMWNLKRNYINELAYHIETDLQTWRMNLQLLVGKDGGKG